MGDKEKKALIAKIKNAIMISSEKMLSKKKSLGQKLIISENGVIKSVKPN
jgi:hypothetical protein